MLRTKCASRKSPRAIYFLLGIMFGLPLTPSNLAAQAPDAIFGKWSDAADKKTCDIPVGSSPDVATLYQISPKGIAFYEIDCATRDVIYRESGADFDLDCFKGAAGRWFEKASVRPSGPNRLALSFSNRRPPLGGSDWRTETLYRCPAEKMADTKTLKAVVSEWRHNGSVMSMSEKDGNIELAHLQPRPGMLAVGVRANTTLFIGQRDGEKIEGTAYIFHPQCGPFGFQAKGRFLDRERLLHLEGMSPRLNRGCGIERELPEVLRFERPS